MSMFGGFGQPTANKPNTSKPSLFGSLGATSSAAPSGGLFGAPTNPTSAAGSSGGLFGAPTNPTSSAAPSGSLFGSLGASTSKAPSGGLFGAQPPGNLFGKPTKDNPPASSGGLFGSASNASAAPSGGLFGSATKASSGPPDGLFGGANKAASGPPDGLFGGANKTSAPATGGLFGSLGATSSASSGGFLGAPATSSAAPAQSALPFGAPSNSSAFPLPKLGSSILGGASSAPASKPSSSPFGGLGASAAPSSGSGLLGGGLGTSGPSSTPKLGSVFGATGTSAPLGGVLWGSSTTTARPQDIPGLFNQSRSQALPGLGQSLQSSQQKYQQDRAQESDPAASTARPAYFDGLLQKSKQKQLGEDEKNGLEALPSLQLNLGDISRRARELGGAGINGRKPGDSKAHYLLAASGIMPGSALRDLQDFNDTAGPPSSQPLDSSTAAVDIDKYVANLHAKTSQVMIQEALATSTRDFDAFLEENVTMDWDEQRRKVYEHFGLTPKARLGESAALGESGGFGRSRRQARSQSRGKSQSQSRSVGASRFGKSGFGKSLNRSILGTPGRPGQAMDAGFADVAESSPSISQTGDRSQQQKQQDFADQIHLLNVARANSDLYPILHNLGKVEGKTEADQGSAYIDTYRALIQIIGERQQMSRPSEPGAIKERHYAEDYLDESPNSAKAIAFRKRVLNGSRAHLESTFLREMESLISKNPREARLGGVPNIRNKIRAYINIRHGRKDLAPEGTELQMIGTDYCWVVVFFLLRCGQFKEATEYVTSNASAFRAIDRNFATYITNFYNSEDRRLKHDLQSRIDAEYNQRTKIAPENSYDPFRMACYKIIGRCELSKRNLNVLTGGIEDWMWLQFSLARESSRVSDPEPFGLNELRLIIRDIGQKFYGKQGEPLASFGTYFRLLVLGGMFEQAVAFLYPHSYISAVHYAIALDYYGLLRVTEVNAADSDLLSFNTRQLPQLCFGRMIGYYTRDFRSVAAAPAADYLTLICLNSKPPSPDSQSHTQLCHAALRDLILETREYSTLLGDMRPDGTRIPGAIEKHLSLINLEDRDEFLRNVTVQAAASANESGRTTDAVLLYHLAEDYENVTTILNRALSEAVAVDIGQEALRLQPLKPRSAANTAAKPEVGSSLSLLSVENPEQLASNMIGLYNSNAMFYRRIDPQNRVTCGVLIQLSQVKELVAAQKWPAALDRIAALNILPLNANGSIPLIRTSAQAFASLAQPIARNIGPLLMWTITCCGKQRDILKAGAYVDRTRAEMANALLTRAKDCMVFAGLIRYKLTGRVYDMLAQAAGEGEAF